MLGEKNFVQVWIPSVFAQAQRVQHSLWEAILRKNRLWFGSSEAILKALFHQPESIIFKLFFFINFIFDFGVLAQTCLKPCLNGVLKFHFFFLNLSSKFPAGVRIRKLKYPYMDICDPYTGKKTTLHYKDFWQVKFKITKYFTKMSNRCQNGPIRMQNWNYSECFFFF